MMNIINNFFKGQISLWKSFWVIGIISYLIVVFIADSILFPNSLYYQMLTVGIWLIFFSIGVCKSANNYQGSKWWSNLAKLFILVFTYANLTTGVKPVLYNFFGYDGASLRVTIVGIPWLIISIYYYWRIKPT